MQRARVCPQGASTVAIAKSAAVDATQKTGEGTINSGNLGYFIYIGELKNYGLNIFLKEALSRIWNQPVDFIAVVPDILEQYAYSNILVINPLAMENFLRVKQSYSCRVPGPTFMREVSQSPHVIHLIKKLLGRQDRVYIYMVESLQEMSLDDMEGVEILGPKSFVAHRLNNKMYQYRLFKQIVNVPEFKICEGWEDLQAATKRLRKERFAIQMRRRRPTTIVNFLLRSSDGVNSVALIPVDTPTAFSYSVKQ